MKLREIRRQKNISQIELSKIIGVSQKSISDYEIEKTQPDFKTIIKLADYFHTTVDNLIGHEVPYLLDKSTLTTEQRLIIDEIPNLDNEQCIMVLGYIEGLKEGKRKHENIVNQFYKKGQ